VATGGVLTSNMRLAGRKGKLDELYVTRMVVSWSNGRPAVDLIDGLCSALSFAPVAYSRVVYSKEPGAAGLDGRDDACGGVLCRQLLDERSRTQRFLREELQRANIQQGGCG
jgi:hypothetical protein